MNWIDEYIDNYYKWLKDNTIIKKNSETNWISIETPFVGLFNDNIEIYAKQEGDKILLSDDSMTLRNLENSGLSLKNKKREFINKILLNYGIKNNNGELIVEAYQNEFPIKKHNLISAISEISDMSYTASHNIHPIFNESIKDLLDKNDIIYTEQFIARGATGIEFTFDFQVASKKKELVIKSFNTLTKTNVPNYLFSIEDIKETREKTTGKELLSIAIINDQENQIKEEFLNAFNSRNTEYFMWKDRDKIDNINKIKMTA